MRKKLTFIVPVLFAVMSGWSASSTAAFVYDIFQCSNFPGQIDCTNQTLVGNIELPSLSGNDVTGVTLNFTFGSTDFTEANMSAANWEINPDDWLITHLETEFASNPECVVGAPLDTYPCVNLTGGFETLPSVPAGLFVAAILTSVCIENGFCAFSSSIGVVHNFVPRGDPLPAVPIPAAAWLFVTALLGLAGIARRKGWNRWR